MSDSPIILGAELGIPLSFLTEEELKELTKVLTITSRPWKNNPSITVEGFRLQDDYIWVPRQFGLDSRYAPDLDLRAKGLPQNLESKIILDPETDQPNAVTEMVKYLEKYKSGILIAPTSVGKSLLSLEIASKFKTSIGVFIYVGHMTDNWIREAGKVFGLAPEDIGIVQQDKIELGKPVTLMSVQSLISRTYPKELYEQIGFLIADEITKYSSSIWGTLIRQFPAKYRIGLTAELTNNTGLGKVLEWNFGEVGYTIEIKNKKKTIIRVHTNATYSENSYKDFTSTMEKGEFVADALRYDKQLIKDTKRNTLILGEILNARKQGRRILVFSKLRAHLDNLKTQFEELLAKQDSEYPATVCDFLVGGMKKKQREQAALADVKFATYSYCRDAMNDTSNDTIFFCTPPGNPLQPAGRLRDKGPADRKSLMIVTFTEDTLYAEEKWLHHQRKYLDLGYEIIAKKRDLK